MDLARLEAKTEKAIGKKCNLSGADEFTSIESLFACPGATTVADLQACIVCGMQQGASELFVQQNAGTFHAIVEPTDDLQGTIDTAPEGSTLLLMPGDYDQPLVIQTHGTALVGCGAARNDRPRIIAPPGSTSGSGIFAANVNGLHFQSLEIIGWPDNGIFVRDACDSRYRRRLIRRPKRC